MLDFDIKDRNAVRKMQDVLLSETVQYVSRKSEFYRARFKELGLEPRSFRSVEDITRLPVTAKEDIQKDNWSFLCVDKQNVAEVVATTGTTGNPVFFALTGGDLERLAENEARTFAAMGVGAGDLVQVAVTLDNLFIAGLAYYSGLRRVGAGALRTGPLNPRRQLELLCSAGPRAMVSVPSFLLHMAREAERSGVPLEGLRLEKALLIGETVRGGDLASNNLGGLVEDVWKIETFSTYGITEASNAFAECERHSGLHAHPDFLYAEVLDDSGTPVPDGQPGELVVTTFKVEGMPLLRYRTGDITFMVNGRCMCGSAAQRIGPVIGRKSHRLKIKGTTVYPSTIENALMDIKGIVNYQITAHTGKDGADCITVKIGSERKEKGFVEEIRSSLRSFARFTPDVEVLKPEDVETLLYEGGRRKKTVFKDMRSNTVLS